MASFTIKLKGDTTIVFNDIIDLTDDQIALILSQAEKKTLDEWLDPDTKGVKIPLSPNQRTNVLSHKNKLVDGHTSQTLRSTRRIRFTQHFLDRVALRIDGGAVFPSQQSLTGMVDLVISSNDLEKNAEWRGYGGLSYSFTGEYNGKPCSVAVTFEGHMMLITVTTKGPSPTTTRISNLIPDEKWARIRDIVGVSKPRRRRK